MKMRLFPCSTMVEHSTDNPRLEGSNPVTCTEAKKMAIKFERRKRGHAMASHWHKHSTQNPKIRALNLIDGSRREKMSKKEEIERKCWIEFEQIETSSGFLFV